MYIYIAGNYIGGEPPNTSWDMLGVFDKEEDAVAACTKLTNFVGPVEKNKRLADEITEWEGCYYPLDNGTN